MKFIITLFLSLFMTVIYAQKTIVLSNTASDQSLLTFTNNEIAILKSMLDKLKTGEVTNSSFSKTIINDKDENDITTKISYKINLNETSNVTEIETLKKLDIEELEEAMKQVAESLRLIVTKEKDKKD